MIREFRDPSRIEGMVDYYLTAYQSVFDFIETMSADKLKINKDVFNSYLAKNEHLGVGVNEEKTKKIVSVLGDDAEAVRSLLIHNLKDSLKFEKSTYKSLFITDIKDLHTEYQTVLANYAALSELIKRYV